MMAHSGNCIATQHTFRKTMSTSLHMPERPMMRMEHVFVIAQF